MVEVGIGAPRRVAHDGELGDAAADDTVVYDTAAAVLGAIRKAKSTAQRSMRADVAAVVVRAPAEIRRALELSFDDVREAGRVTAPPEFLDAPELSVEVELADPDAA